MGLIHARVQRFLVLFFFWSVSTFSFQAGTSLLGDKLRQRSELQVLPKSRFNVIPRKLQPQLPPRVVTTIKLNGKLRQ